MIDEQIANQLMEAFEPNYKLGASDLAWFLPRLNDAIGVAIGKVALEHHKMKLKERHDARAKAKGSKPKGRNAGSEEPDADDATKKQKKPTKAPVAPSDEQLASEPVKS